MDIQETAKVLGPMYESIAHDGALALKALDLPDGAAVLDVGTGAGKFAIFLATQGYYVLTGEPADDSTHYANKDWALNAEKVGVKDMIHFQPFNAGQMPFEDGAFGAVFFFGVLHHIDEALRADVMREAMRVVGDGGSVVLFEPTQETLEKIWPDDPDHPPAAAPSDYVDDLKVVEQRLDGVMMHIYIYSRAD